MFNTAGVIFNALLEDVFIKLLLEKTCVYPWKQRAIDKVLTQVGEVKNLCCTKRIDLMCRPLQNARSIKSCDRFFYEMACYFMPLCVD